MFMCEVCMSCVVSLWGYMCSQGFPAPVQLHQLCLASTA